VRARSGLHSDEAYFDSQLDTEHNWVMTTLYRADDRNLLTSVLRAEAVHLGPGAILDGLTAEQALAKPHNLPHSIAEIVAHICYWQVWFNGCAVAGFTGIAEHAVDGWPPVPADGWDALRTRYLRSIEEAQRIAAESDSLADPLLPPGVHIPSLALESRGSGILHAAVHSSHHMGQIITMRQLMALWPPPGGTITW
jgi:uncharacterized damage-inducible protein DinB